MKPEDEPKCCCSDLLAKIVEQNTILIQQIERKDQIILAAIEQNNELLMQLADEEESQPKSGYLDG